MKWLARQFRTFVALYHWWRRRFTPGGQALSIAWAVCLPGVFSQTSALVLLGAALGALLLTAALAAAIFRPRLAARLRAAPLLVRGQSAMLPIVLQNMSRLPADDLRVRCGDDDRWRATGKPVEVALAAEQACDICVQIVARERGIFPAPPLLVTDSLPLGLIRTTRPVAVQGEVAVAPNYRPLARFEVAALELSSPDDALAAAPTAGDRGDYVGSREHVSGQPVRRWDYASWARLQRPIAREYREPPAGRVAIVLDTCAPPGDALEALVSHAAAVGEALFDAGLSVVLWQPDDDELPQYAEMGSQRDLLYALAAVAPAANHLRAGFVEALAEHDWSSHRVFVLSGDDTAAQRELCMAIDGYGCRAVPLAIDHAAVIAREGVFS